MTRVALFAPSLAGGGAERVMVTVANGLSARGVAVDLVLARAVGPYMAEIAGGVRIVDLKARRMIAGIIPLARYLRTERPDAMLATLMHANVAAVAARALSMHQCRLVLREANMVAPPARGFRLRDRALRALGRAAYGRADLVVAVSEAVAGDLLDRFRLSPEQVRVIYNPVADRSIRIRGDALADHPWFAEAHVPVLVAVGRLTEQKDYVTLLRAFARMRAERPLRLVILGEGEARAALERLARELAVADEVCFAGFVEDPLPFVARASLFVLTSRWEGLPNALIQALALGTPAVATDCPGGVREILANGAFGGLVPVGDSAAFARAALDALEQPCDQTRLQEQAARFDLGARVHDYGVALGVLSDTRRACNEAAA